jgi:hypothetical protein
MPGDGAADIQWASRVPKRKIERLYETDAKGIYDEDLIDDVGFGLLARCESFITAVEAHRGRAACARCATIIPHNWQKAARLLCEGCGWETTWGAYFKTMQHRQLSGAEPVITAMEEYMRGFRVARSSQEKMILIDRLIHSHHWADDGPTRPVAVNLIEGRMHDVVDFLDGLSYGGPSTPGTRKMREEWRRNVNAAAERWGDERLKRP